MPYQAILIGAEKSGKTCLSDVIRGKDFPKGDISSTSGVAFASIRKEIQGKVIQLLIGDLSGQRRFLNLTPVYVKDKDVIIFCTDLSQDNNTIEQDIKGHISVLDTCALKKDVKILVVGTKADLVDKSQIDSKMIDIHEQVVAQLPNRKSNIVAKPIAVSAETGKNVEVLRENIFDIVAHSLDAVKSDFRFSLGDKSSCGKNFVDILDTLVLNKQADQLKLETSKAQILETAAAWVKDPKSTEARKAFKTQYRFFKRKKNLHCYISGGYGKRFFGWLLRRKMRGRKMFGEKRYNKGVAYKKDVYQNHVFFRPPKNQKREKTQLFAGMYNLRCELKEKQSAALPLRVT